MSDYTTRVYTPRGTVAHLVENTYGNGAYRLALCGLWQPAGFYGTGAQHEYERAAALPVCSKCLKKNGGTE